MSSSAVRQAIATALSTLDVVTGYAHRPTVLHVGDAWPQWAGQAYAGGHAYTQTWNVLVVLPQLDDVHADDWNDEHGDAIRDVLRPILFVDSVQPAKISTDAGDLYGLLFTGRE